MRYQTTWGRECPRLYQYFMPLQRATLCVASPGEARRLHSQFESISQPSQIPSYSLQFHLLVQYVKHAWNVWNVSSSLCTTEQVTRPVLMRPGSNVCTQRSSIWCYPTNQGGPVKAHKQSCLPSWTLVGKALTPCPDLPSPGDWGWILKEGEWQPFWTTLPDVTKSCKELFRYGCKRGCRGPWSALLFEAVMTNATTYDCGVL